MQPFPTNKELEQAVVDALGLLGGEATVTEINKKVIEILKLPEEIVLLEDSSCTCTKLDYRLRWCRTNLKGKKIENISKGTWRIKR